MYPELEQSVNTSWTVEAVKALKPGSTLYGYCGGYFGRDSYENKTIIKVEVSYIEYPEGVYLELHVRDTNGVLDQINLESYSEVSGLIESSNLWRMEHEEKAAEDEN